jgi:hypothetical protein
VGPTFTVVAKGTRLSFSASLTRVFFAEASSVSTKLLAACLVMPSLLLVSIE